MSLAAVAKLLQTALALLALVSSHPELPQSMRDNAMSIAHNAISQATAVLTNGQTATQTKSTGTQTFTPVVTAVATPAITPTVSPASQPIVPQQNNNPASAAQTDSCAPWPAADGIKTAASLQTALYTDPCVSIPAGTYVLDNSTLPGKGLIIPSNHTLKGAGATATTLKADPQTWTISVGPDSVLTHSGWGPGGDTTGVHISGLTIDGSGIASFGIIADGMDVENVIITNTRCNDFDINGPGIVLKNSTLTNSAQTVTIPGRGVINCATRPDDSSGTYGGVQLGAAIYGEGYIFNGVPLRNFPADIENNTIYNNIGPALDMNNVDGGTFANNTVYGNTGWAGVGLFQSSNWNILNNTISHPTPDPSTSYSEYVYHPDCGPSPSGSGEQTAGIIVCSDAQKIFSGLNLSPSMGNKIIGNHAVGYYGVLLVGAGTAQNPALTPYGNDIENNNVYGSYVGCGDEFNPAWATASTPANTWSGNNCNGTPNTPPQHL